jgi:hypothetical protein
MLTILPPVPTIDPRGIYDDATLGSALDLGPDVFARARKARELRFTRKGRRTLYLGEWVLAWLASEAPGGVVAKGAGPRAEPPTGSETSV